MSGRGVQGTNDGGMVVYDNVEKMVMWRSKVGAVEWRSGGCGRRCSGWRRREVGGR